MYTPTNVGLKGLHTHKFIPRMRCIFEVRVCNQIIYYHVNLTWNNNSRNKKLVRSCIIIVKLMSFNYSTDPMVIRNQFDMIRQGSEKILALQ